MAIKGYRLRATAAAAVVGGLLAAGHFTLDRRPALQTRPLTVPSASPSPSVAADVLPDPAASVGAAVAATLAAYVGAHRAHAGIAVVDRVTGVSVTYNGGVRFATASVVKVDILATLLWQAQRAGREPTTVQRRRATEMITESDNDAADELWETVGGAGGVGPANRAFGLHETSPNRAGYWGMTSTTVADQVRLLGVLADPAGPLSTGSRGYLLGLMSRVESGQRWGVPRAAGTGASAVYVKNGWLASVADRGRWIVNSVGRIVEPGHDWLVAVLSDHNPTEAGGISLVEHLARTALTGLRAGR